MAIRFRYSKRVTILALSNNGRSQMSDIIASHVAGNGISLRARLGLAWHAVWRAVELRSSRRKLAD